MQVVIRMLINYLNRLVASPILPLPSLSIVYNPLMILLTTYLLKVLN